MRGSSVRRAAAAVAYGSLKRRAPRAYLRVIAWRGADVHPVTPDTALVIAGMPGSANSFLRTAVLTANPQLPVSSHAHVWTEVVDGLRYGRPVILLVRDPVDEAASRLARFGNTTPAAALREYAEYHERVLPYRDDVVVASFEAATSSPAAVIQRTNERFGCALHPFPQDDPVQRRLLQERLASKNGAVPDPQRAAALAQARARVLAPELAVVRARCRGLHAELIAAADVAGLGPQPDEGPPAGGPVDNLSGQDT